MLAGKKRQLLKLNAKRSISEKALGASKSNSTDSVYFVTATHSKYGKVRMVESDSRASALAWIKKYRHMHPESGKYVITKRSRADWNKIYGNSWD